MVEVNCDVKVMNEIVKIIDKYKDNFTKKGKRISYLFYSYLYFLI